MLLEKVQLEQVMKIRLLMTIPVSKDHGLVEGKILEAVTRADGSTWVKSESGEEVKLHSHEFEVVEDV